MNINKYDREYIKNEYGSIKNYKQLKKEKSKKDRQQFFKDEQVKFNDVLINSTTIEAIKVGARNRERRKQIEEIQEIMVKKYNREYNKWLLVYDLINNSLHEIKRSLNKNKITINDLKEVIKECNEIYNIFNYNDIIEQLKYM